MNDNALHLVIIEDQPHELEEEIKGHLDDGNRDRVDAIFLNLYKENRIEEIEYILTRYLFTPDEVAATLERLGNKVNELEEEDHLKDTPRDQEETL